MAGLGMLGCGAAAFALLTTSTPATAAEAQASSGVLEEVVVTARYREEKLQETPIAITAITGAEIQARGITSAYEIGYSVPNASLRPAQAAFGNSMSAYIRGIGQYDFLGEFEPGVGIYFDDVLHPVVMGSMIDLMDLERVEVLRGPQGTLFGRGSIGGAIRYVSKQPKGDNTGNIQLTYGDFNRVDVRGSYDFAITDKLFARVTGVSKRRDGYQKVLDFACANPTLAGTIPRAVANRVSGCQVGTQGGEDVTGARAALRLVASDSLELGLVADYQNDNSEARADTLVGIAGPGGAFGVWSQHYLVPTYGVPFDSRFVPSSPFISYATYRDLKSGLTFSPKTALEQRGVSATADWKMGTDLGGKLILSHREFNSAFATDADQSPFNEQTVDGHQKFSSDTAELRLSGKAMEKLNWTLGGFYYKGDFKSGQTVSIPAFIFAGVYGGVLGAPTVANPAGTPPCFGVVTCAEGIASGVINNNAKWLVNGLNDTKSKNISVFAAGDYDFTDKLSMSAGLRYSKDDKDDNFDNTIVKTTLGTSEKHTDWKLGLNYKFTDDVMGYVSASTGYRPQAFNPRPFQVTQFVQVSGEEAKSYELGLKGDFFDRRLRANAAVFYIDYSKRILPVGGTECLLIPGSNPPAYNTVPPGTPGSVVDTLGNTCMAVTSRTFYQNSPGKIKGGELELTWQPVEGLTFNGNFGYTDFSADDLNNPGVVNPDPIFVPKQNWSVSAAYEIALSGGSRITPRLDLYGQSEICTGATTKTSCSEGYELLNARLEWASPDRTWTTALGATNLSDKQYYLNKFDLTAFGQPTTEGQPGIPREWYLQVSRNFK
jgi:iron complex outermembrane receptor protein